MVAPVHSPFGIRAGIPVTLRGLRIMCSRAAQAISAPRSATVRHFYDAAHAPKAISLVYGACYHLRREYGQKPPNVIKATIGPPLTHPTARTDGGHRRTDARKAANGDRTTRRTGAPQGSARPLRRALTTGGAARGRQECDPHGDLHRGKRCRIV